MPQYLALTQQTCSWLLSHSTTLSVLHDSIVGDDLRSLAKAEFAAGPLRMAGTADENLVAVWNREYLTGTGFESWGIIKIGGEFGLLANSGISQPVFERTIYVFSQRLQGLMVESEFIHRTWPNGSQTCLAGRGTEARKFSICYFEGSPGYGGLHSRAIISIGPTFDFTQLQVSIQSEMPLLANIAKDADALIEAKRRPLVEAPSFSALRSAVLPAHQPSLQFTDVSLQTDYNPASAKISAYETAHWSYHEWATRGVLNEAQRRILESDVLLKHPVRVTGPAGSGKTLLMQLLALRHLKKAHDADEPLRVLYVVHNAPMAANISDRFRVLGGEEYLTGSRQMLRVTTLSDYGRQIIGLTEDMVIDKDAHGTKVFQLEQVQAALRDTLDNNPQLVGKSGLFKQIISNDDLFRVVSFLIVAEISNVIKGRGLIEDEKRYVSSETAYSRLHGIMSPDERAIVFDCFRRYHKVIFEQYEMLDSDDLALSLAGRLRTPLWELKRKKDGFDFIFVDEAQLFNENERRVFPYLATGRTNHVPIALALDEAQDLFGLSNAGLANLGISDVENENLPSNHRSTKEIIKLAFHIIQQTTDLFTSDFPDFEIIEKSMVASDHPLAEPPSIIKCPDDQENFGKFILNQVSRMRRENVRQIAVVCHAETYWHLTLKVLQASGLPLHIIEQRGEKISPDQPMVIFSRPAFVGGQEFDAVLSIGLEQGLVPPRIVDNVALSAAVEQQTLRETYLVITRSRYRYISLINRTAVSNSILEDAVVKGLIKKSIAR